MNNIGVGDLVEVVRWPCCVDSIGLRRVVTKVIIDHHLRGVECKCGAITLMPARFPIVVDETIAPDGDGPVCIPMAWVRRIPPEEIDRLIETEEFA